MQAVNIADLTPPKTMTININELAEELSKIDEIEQWPEHLSHITYISNKGIYAIAEPLWLERTHREGKLYVHPNVAKQLHNQFWKANDLQKRMIWASIIGSADGADSKARFKDIKAKILKKYGRDWWEDVYKRKTNVYAAKSRIKNQLGLQGPALQTLVNNTSLFAGIERDQIQAALEMIPEN